MTQNSNNITQALFHLGQIDRENIETLHELKRKIMHYVVDNKNKGLFKIIDSWATQNISIILENQSRQEYEENIRLHNEWIREMATEEEEIVRLYLGKDRHY